MFTIVKPPAGDEEVCDSGSVESPISVSSNDDPIMTPTPFCAGQVVIPNAGEVSTDVPQVPAKSSSKVAGGAGAKV